MPPLFPYCDPECIRSKLSQGWRWQLSTVSDAFQSLMGSRIGTTYFVLSLRIDQKHFSKTNKGNIKIIGPGAGYTRCAQCIPVKMLEDIWCAQIKWLPTAVGIIAGVEVAFLVFGTKIPFLIRIIKFNGGDSTAST